MGGRRVVVTGAFGTSGRYVAERLLRRGDRVTTLTGSRPRSDPFRGRVAVRPFDFAEPEALRRTLDGADVLVNTYWVRFNHRRFCHADAVTNTEALFAAARDAAVGRVVHVSITNPSEDSPFEYFRGKARLERALVETGLPHSILRPAVLFGGGNILINNIAYFLRRLPVFGVFGNGAYGIEPIHVEDFAALAVRECGAGEDRTIDAVGPEAFTYRELISEIARILGLRRVVLGVPKTLGWLAGRVSGAILGDVTITWEEIGGLTAGLLATGSPPVGTRRLTAWAVKNRETLGRQYASELARRR